MYIYIVYYNYIKGTLLSIQSTVSTKSGVTLYIFRMLSIALQQNTYLRYSERTPRLLSSPSPGDNLSIKVLCCTGKYSTK